MTSPWDCNSAMPALVFCEAGTRTSAQPWSLNPLGSHGHSPGRIHVSLSEDRTPQKSGAQLTAPLAKVPLRAASRHRRVVPQLASVPQAKCFDAGCAGPSPATRWLWPWPSTQSRLQIQHHSSQDWGGGWGEGTARRTLGLLRAGPGTNQLSWPLSESVMNWLQGDIHMHRSAQVMNGHKWNAPV